MSSVTPTTQTAVQVTAPAAVTPAAASVVYRSSSSFTSPFSVNWTPAATSRVYSKIAGPDSYKITKAFAAVVAAIVAVATFVVEALVYIPRTAYRLICQAAGCGDYAQSPVDKARDMIVANANKLVGLIPMHEGVVSNETKASNEATLALIEGCRRVVDHHMGSTQGAPAILNMIDAELRSYEALQGRMLPTGEVGEFRRFELAPVVDAVREVMGNQAYRALIEKFAQEIATALTLDAQNPLAMEKTDAKINDFAAQLARLVPNRTPAQIRADILKLINETHGSALTAAIANYNSFADQDHMNTVFAGQRAALQADLERASKALNEAHPEFRNRLVAPIPYGTEAPLAGATLPENATLEQIYNFVKTEMTALKAQIAALDAEQIPGTIGNIREATAIRAGQRPGQSVPTTLHDAAENKVQQAAKLAVRLATLEQRFADIATFVEGQIATRQLATDALLNVGDFLAKALKARRELIEAINPTAALVRVDQLARPTVPAVATTTVTTTTTAPVSGPTVVTVPVPATVPAVPAGVTRGRLTNALRPTVVVVNPPVPANAPVVVVNPPAPANAPVATNTSAPVNTPVTPANPPAVQTGRLASVLSTVQGWWNRATTQAPAANNGASPLPSLPAPAAPAASVTTPGNLD